MTQISDILNTDELEPAEPIACSVTNESGIFYAQLYVPGHIEPMHVALHGVTTAIQAAQALESFARLRTPEPVAA